MATQSIDKPDKKVDVGPWAMRLTFLVIGIGVLVGGLKYGLETKAGLVGPGMVPFSAGLIMVIATLVECVRSLRPAAAAEEEPTENAIADADQVEAADRSPQELRRAVMLVFGVILATVILTRVIGLLLSLSLMVLVLIDVVERKPWWTGVIAAIGVFVFGWSVFSLVLNVPLPTGMLGLI